VKTRDGEGFESETVYHPDGLKEREKDRRRDSPWRTFTYDDLGRLTHEQIATWYRRIVHDDLARTRSEYDALEQRTVFQLDKMERVVEVRDNLSKSARMGYDGVNKRWEKDKRGHQRDFEYDALHRR
jgi:hypothetical protein